MSHTPYRIGRVFHEMSNTCSGWYLAVHATSFTVCSCTECIAPLYCLTVHVQYILLAAFMLMFSFPIGVDGDNDRGDQARLTSDHPASR